MHERSLNLTDLPLIVPDFYPEYVEEVLKLGLVTFRDGPSSSLAGPTSGPQSEEPNSGTSSKPRVHLHLDLIATFLVDWGVRL